MPFFPRAETCKCFSFRLVFGFLVLDVRYLSELDSLWFSICLVRCEDTKFDHTSSASGFGFDCENNSKLTLVVKLYPYSDAKATANSTGLMEIADRYWSFAKTLGLRDGRAPIIGLHNIKHLLLGEVLIR